MSRRCILRAVASALLVIGLWAAPKMAQAAIVTQLDITSGSIDLNLGSLGNISGNFAQNGLLVMNQYQPPPNIFNNPINIGQLTFSIFTSGMPFPGMPGGAPVPTGQTSGSTITVDLRSLFAGVTSQSWSWMNVASLNIGGNASGTFNETTSTFDISWTHSFTGVDILPDVNIPFLTSGIFRLQGTTQLVPLPASLLLFGTGLSGLLLARARKLFA